MITEFDKIIDEYLNELQSINEAPIELGGDIKDLHSKIVQKAEQSPMSGHFKGLKRLADMSKAVMDILQIVLPEKNPKTGKENAYNSSIDTKEELKTAVYRALEEIAQKKGYAEQFAGDRVTTMILKDIAFEVAGDIQSGRPVTQKEIKQKLNKKLQEKPASEVELTYYRVADLDSDDEALVKAFNKIPAEGNIKWSEIVSKVGEEAANALKKIGALIEVVGAEDEEDEEKEIPALDFDDENDVDISSNFDKVIDPYFSTTRDDYFRD